MYIESHSIQLMINLCSFIPPLCYLLRIMYIVCDIIYNIIALNIYDFLRGPGGGSSSKFSRN